MFDEEDVELDPITGQPVAPSSAPAAESQSEMNPMVRDHLMKKFNLGEYGDDQRKQAVESSHLDLGDRLMAALAAVGAGFSGGDPSAAGNARLKMAQDQKNRELQQFDEGRKRKIDDYRLDKEFTADQSALDRSSRDKDPMSQESMMAQALAKRMGYQGDTKNITADQFKAFSPSLQKMYDIEQRKLDRQDSREVRHEATDQIRSDRAAREAKLSDKQVEGINDFDDTISKAQNSLTSLGNNTNWVGPLDARVPDAVVGDDQVAFRSSVGRMADAYRKLITGAGASSQELARLESRLPQTSDTAANFKAKAMDLIREAKKAKETHLQNYSRSGKNTQEFASPAASGGYPKQVRNGNRVATVSSAQEEKEAAAEGFQ